MCDILQRNILHYFSCCKFNKQKTNEEIQFERIKCLPLYYKLKRT